MCDKWVHIGRLRTNGETVLASMRHFAAAGRAPATTTSLGSSSTRSSRLAARPRGVTG